MKRIYENQDILMFEWFNASNISMFFININMKGFNLFESDFDEYFKYSQALKIKNRHLYKLSSAELEDFKFKIKVYNEWIQLMFGKPFRMYNDVRYIDYLKINDDQYEDLMNAIQVRNMFDCLFVDNDKIEKLAMLESDESTLNNFMFKQVQIKINEIMDIIQRGIVNISEIFDYGSLSASNKHKTTKKHISEIIKEFKRIIYEKNMKAYRQKMSELKIQI